MTSIRLHKEQVDPWRWLSALCRLESEAGSTETHHSGAPEGLAMLHSAGEREGFGHWTLITAGPVAVAKGSRTSVEVLTLVGPGLTLRCQDPFDAVEKLMALRPSDISLTPCPFAFPAVGAWGYGCGEGTTDTGLSEGQEGGHDLWWGLYDTFVALHPQHGGYLVTHSSDHLGCTEAAGAKARRWLEAYQQAEPVKAGDSSPRFRPIWQKEEYAEAYTSIIDGLVDGSFYQACLTHPLLAERGAVNAAEFFRWTSETYQAPFSALLVTDSASSTIVSSSPERFLRFEDGTVIARPMKGTRKRRAGREEEDREVLQTSAKDRAENVMIVDLMRNDLGRLCALGSVEVPELFHVETFGEVHQMTSTVRGRMREDVTLPDMVRAAFPPGSMTGAPKVEAMKRLRTLEPHPRGWYSGCLGWLEPDRGELSVVIRSALLGPESIRWHVGGGIVADSTCEGEWQESLDKGPSSGGTNE